MANLLALLSLEGIVVAAPMPNVELRQTLIPTLQETPPSTLLFCFLGTLVGILLIILMGFVQAKYDRAKAINQKPYLGIDLGYKTLANNEIHLKIYNNEKSSIMINEISIIYKDGPAKEQEPDYWSRVFLPSGFRVEKGGTETTPFIVEKMSPPSFSAIRYRDERETIDHIAFDFGFTNLMSS